MAPKETISEAFRTLQKKFQNVVQETLSSDLSRKIQTQVSERFQGKLGERLAESVQKVSQVTQVASATAKYGLQQALSEIEKRGLDVNDPKAFAHSLGQKAREQAERLRLKVLENPLGPAWLRDVSFAPQDSHPAVEETEVREDQEIPATEAAAAGSVVESVLSEPALDMQPDHQEEIAVPKKRRTRSSKSTPSSRTSH